MTNRLRFVITLIIVLSIVFIALVGLSPIVYTATHTVDSFGGYFYIDNPNLESINIKDFGAKGDGTADADNIQKAVDYAKSKGCKQIIIPKPTAFYYIDKTIRVPSNIEIIGDGSLLRAKTYTDVGFYPVLIFQNEDYANFNIKFQGLIFDGGWINETRVNAGTFDKVNNLLKLSNVEGVVIKDCEFRGYNSNTNPDYTENDAFTRWSLFAFLNCNNLLIEGVKMNSCCSEGFMFYKCNNLSLERIETNNVRMTTPLHFWYCDGVKLINSVILEDTGVKARGSTINVYSKNVLIDNCIFEGGTSIDIGNEREEKFTSTFIAENITISNCKIKTSINAQGTSKIYQNNRKLHIIGNSIDATGYKYGIRPGNLDDGIFENNTIFGAETAIRVFGENFRDVIIRNNNIYDVFKGIQVAIKDGCIVENLSIENNDMTLKELSGRSSIKGISSGIHFSSDKMTLGTEKLKNIYINKNRISSNDSWIYINYPLAKIPVSNVHIKNNEFNSKSFCKNGLQLRGTIGLVIARNIFKNGITDVIGDGSE